MTTTQLCFIDTETTGLDARIHQPYELAYWLEDAMEPTVLSLPHTLEYADQMALKVGGYFERGFFPYQDSGAPKRRVAKALAGVTLVGANPGFDAAMMTRYIGAPVWHYRLIDIESMAAGIFDWDRPQGMAGLTAHLHRIGYEIPEPDHTAEGDVRATRAIYDTLREVRGDLDWV